MKAYKGFNKDMTCHGFQYKEGREYATSRAMLCEIGYHACENPLDCLTYYSPNDGCVYHEVEVSGDIEKADDDTKVAATKIKIGARLTIAGIVKGAIDFIFSKAKPTTGDHAHAATSGDRAHAATTGYGANAATTGYGANAATTGDHAHAATSGDRAHAATSGKFANATTSGDRAHAATSGEFANATTSGDWAHAEAKGEGAIAAVLGRKCQARGALGCWLVLTERDDCWNILGVQAVKVDGKKYKADTWYELRGGEVVEVKDGEANNG